jgi:predicted NBD/HSP70 family sugar kinase
MNGMVALIDIGAGRGAKLALADRDGDLSNESLLPVSEYGTTGNEFADRLADRVGKMAGSGHSIVAVSTTVPGLTSGGTVMRCTNLPFLSGFALASALRDRLGVPINMLNDGDAGGLGEWVARKHELIYWALGGGWGGAWVSREGHVIHPSSEFDGSDASLHISSEPGCRARLDRMTVVEALNSHSIPSSWLPDDDQIAAEYLVSGTGRLRIFTALTGSAGAGELACTSDPGAAISDWHREGLAAAARVDAAFGTLLGEATVRILRTINLESGRPPAPVYVGGGTAKALDLFLPQVQSVLDREGVPNHIHPSCYLRNGGNANLVGALLSYSVHNGAQACA